MYYLRIVATNSNFPDSIFGTTVLLNIGEPSDSLVITYYFFRKYFLRGLYY